LHYPVTSLSWTTPASLDGRILRARITIVERE
jgi:hypothetical protein